MATNWLRDIQEKENRIFGADFANGPEKTAIVISGGGMRSGRTAAMLRAVNAFRELYPDAAIVIEGPNGYTEVMKASDYEIISSPDKTNTENE